MGKRSNFALSFWSFGFARERRIAKTEAPNPVQNAGYGGFAFVVVFETAYCARWLTLKLSVSLRLSFPRNSFDEKGS